MSYPTNITKLNMEKKISELGVIELCAGIGQTSLALKKAIERLGLKMKINAFCEIDEFAAMAYRALHDGNIPNLQDMTMADFTDLSCDILLATTPCTNISLIGNQKGFGKDSDTASSIVWHTFRIIDQMKRKPKIIFFENVKAMVSKKNEEDFNALKNELESRGYKVTYKVLDAQDYGVPQHRERVYIVATLGNVEFDFPMKEILTTFLKDILEKEPASRYIEGDMEGKITRANERGYSYRVHNSNSKVAFTLTTKSRGQANNNYIFMEDANEDEVVRFTPKGGALLGDFKKLPVRSLTRLEQGRLMGMSDEDIHKLDFISDTQFSKQMGNGVVIDVVEKIFFNLLSAMYKVEDEPRMVA